MAAHQSSFAVHLIHSKANHHACCVGAHQLHSNGMTRPELLNYHQKCLLILASLAQQPVVYADFCTYQLALQYSMKRFQRFQFDPSSQECHQPRDPGPAEGNLWRSPSLATTSVTQSPSHSCPTAFPGHHVSAKQILIHVAIGKSRVEHPPFQ